VYLVVLNCAREGVLVPMIVRAGGRVDFVPLTVPYSSEVTTASVVHCGLTAAILPDGSFFAFVEGTLGEERRVRPKGWSQAPLAEGEGGDHAAAASAIAVALHAQALAALLPEDDDAAPVQVFGLGSNGVLSRTPRTTPTSSPSAPRRARPTPTRPPTRPTGGGG
jgi:hypothetical protein